MHEVMNGRTLKMTMKINEGKTNGRNEESQKDRKKYNK